MADIVLRDVEKYFGDNYIIRKLNLEIRHREFVVLLGPSGCGKTTTLRAIAGLEDIDTGDILIDGKPVQALQAADRDIAFVFQLFALYPHLTAYENIAFPLRATNESKETVDRRVREAAKALKIEHLLGKRPGALSGGDLQRVAIVNVPFDVPFSRTVAPTSGSLPSVTVPLIADNVCAVNCPMFHKTSKRNRDRCLVFFILRLFCL